LLLIKLTLRKSQDFQWPREALGFLVYCIDDVEQIDEVLNEMGGDAK